MQSVKFKDIALNTKFKNMEDDDFFYVKISENCAIRAQYGEEWTDNFHPFEPVFIGQ
jgi:hypothetical protein